ncbi:MAG: FecR family protein [Treponema sp.]|nr:FecR family protein [Treponema sp.]
MQTAPCKYRVNPGKLLSGLLLCISLSPLAAQDESAVIYKAAGPDFSLSSRGERQIFTPEALGEGVSLEAGDSIQTGPGAFLEIQLLPSGTLIKVSENTTFIFNGYDSPGRFAGFGLIYGRVRLVSGAAGEGGAAVIGSANISVRIEEGDVGMDYTPVSPGRGRGGVSGPALRLYGFRGKAEVFPFPQGSSPARTGETRSITVREGESLSLEIAPALIFAERGGLDGEIVAFWRRHDFSGAPPLAAPPPAPPAVPGPAGYREAPAAIPEPAAAPGSPLSGEDYLAFSRARKVKNTALVTGLLLTTASLAAQGLAYSRFDTGDRTLARNIFIAAYAPMAAGIFTIVTGIFYNPRIGSP